MNSAAVEFGNRVKSQREYKQLSQRSLGKALGKSQSYISLVESGKHMPTKELVNEFAKVLDVSAGYLLGKEPQVPVTPATKENTTYKIIWLEKGNDQELTFTPNDCERYETYGVDSIVFYFDNDSEIKRINIQNATCTIVMKDKTITIISGDFVIEPIKGE